MRRTHAVAMTALTTLFLAEGQRAFFASMFGLAYDALFPELRVGNAAVALLPFLVLLAPLLPVARWSGRAGAVALAAAGVAVFRVPMSHPALETRLLGGALVLAFGAMFITWAVGFLDRRALAAGVVIGLVADPVLRLAGTSYDISLQPGWLPVQAALSLGLLAVVGLWVREVRRREAASGADGLERRAGGLRLRGSLALGVLLFLDLHVLGLPAVAARWTGVPYELAAVATGVAGALGLLAALSLRRPTGGRAVTLFLVAVVAASAILGYAAEGTAIALAMAAGHLGVLLLLSRALDPASGRRSGFVGTIGFSIFTLATALYALTFYPAFTLPELGGAAPWIFGAAALLLAGCFVLLPRPAELESFGQPLAAGGMAALVVLVTVGLAMARPGDGEGVGRLPGRGAPAETASTGTLRVATWNIHYGFDEDWRFDPAAMARTLAARDPAVVALQEVVVGAPTAYGVDLPLWLGRQLRLRDHFSSTINGLLGDAFLTALPDARVDRQPLPSVGGERKQRIRLRTALGGSALSIVGLHLAVEEEARPVQMRAALAGLDAGPTVIVGDLNADSGTAVLRILDRAGFEDVFADPVSAAPTFPAGNPSRRIDWILVRGVDVLSAAVLEATASDHRAVVATLHIQPRRIGSTDENDLQAP